MSFVEKYQWIKPVKMVKIRHQHWTFNIQLSATNGEWVWGIWGTKWLISLFYHVLSLIDINVYIYIYIYMGLMGRQINGDHIKTTEISSKMKYFGISQNQVSWYQKLSFCSISFVVCFFGITIIDMTYSDNGLFNFLDPSPLNTYGPWSKHGIWGIHSILGILGI